MVASYTATREVRARVYSILPDLNREILTELKYYDVPPLLVDSPGKALVEPGAPADTVWFEAIIGKDGRVEMLMLKHSVAGFDSTAAAVATQYVYRPGSSAGRGVRVWERLGIPVPRR
jgi:hypothetical protein